MKTLHSIARVQKLNYASEAQTNNLQIKMWQLIQS